MTLASVFQPFPLFVALRYVTTKRRNRFAAFVSLVSIVGIALGVGALIIVLSVMNGFEREVIRHVLGMSAHAVVFNGDGALRDWPRVQRLLEADPSVVAVAPYLRSSGMLTRKGKVTGVVVEGIDPTQELRVTELAHYVDRLALDQLAPGTNNVLIGDSLAVKIAAAVGDPITLVVPDWDATGAAVAPHYVRLRVAAMFHTGMHEFDGRLVITHLASAQSMFRFGEAVSGLRLRLHDPATASTAAAALARGLGPQFRAIDWSQYERNFFLALKSQKRIMFVILVLIIAVAAFNIAANMIMMVTEKTSDIAILRTCGTTRAQIVFMFLAQGLLLGIVGAALGIGFGAWGAAQSQHFAALVERLFNVDLLNADVYFLDYLPSDLRYDDLIAVVGASLLLSVLATVYPALRAAAIQPARAVHFD